MVRIGINGTGRIGRSLLRLAVESTDLAVVAVNDVVDIGTLQRLLRRDSTFGRFPADIHIVDDDMLMVGDHKVAVSAHREPGLIPWSEHGVDVVVESTGRFRTRELAQAHLERAASHPDHPARRFRTGSRVEDQPRLGVLRIRRRLEVQPFDPRVLVVSGEDEIIQLRSPHEPLVVHAGRVDQVTQHLFR